MGARFDSAMKAEGGKSAGATAPSTGASGLSASMPQITKALDGIVDQMKELVQQLAQLIQAMKGGNSKGASSIGADGRTRSVETGDGDHSGHNHSGLGGTQGPSDRIPDPSSNVREVKLGDKTMTIGSDGSASKTEVDRAEAELKRMYETSPTFKETVNDADGDLTVTLGRRGDNTSWGGGGRVFLNLNNISAGANDRFQGIVGHEFAHAAGLPHGAELDSIEDSVRREA